MPRLKLGRVKGRAGRNGGDTQGACLLALELVTLPRAGVAPILCHHSVSPIPVKKMKSNPKNKPRQIKSASPPFSPPRSIKYGSYFRNKKFAFGFGFEIGFGLGLGLGL